LTCDL